MSFLINIISDYLGLHHQPHRDQGKLIEKIKHLRLLHRTCARAQPNTGTLIEKVAAEIPGEGYFFEWENLGWG